MQNEAAYVPVIADGRGIFPEDLRVKAPRGAGNAISIAARKWNTTKAEWVRQAVLRGLEADGVKLRRGMVELSGEASMQSDLYIDSLPLINSRAADLLDNERLVAQLTGLERRTSGGQGLD